MFEVLLAADRALASGALDQAERAFWQLIDLDPTNAIAVTGLARVSLERGDVRLARTFADRALAMDPESAGAKRILETLKGGDVGVPRPDEPDLPLLAAQRLEELGRRRAAAREDAAELGSRVAGGKPGKRGKAAEDEAAGQIPQQPTTPGSAAAGANAEAAPRPQPPHPKSHQALGDRARRFPPPEDLKPQPRAEDPFAAAESAAAIEAVDETDDIVIEEPIGRAGRALRRLDEQMGELLGAVDATDEDESIAMRVALVADAADLEAEEMEAATFGAVDATDEDDSITMRVALVADAVELEAAVMEAAELDSAAAPEPEPEAMETGAAETVAAEGAEMAAAETGAALEANPSSPVLDEDELDVAEMVAAREFRPAPSRRIDLAALEAELRAAELRAAEHEAGQQGAELAAAEVASAELAAAEVASAELAAAELEAARREADHAEAHALAAEHTPAPAVEAEPGDAGRAALGGPTEHSLPARAASPVDEEPTEQDAESAALREAVAMVLGVDSGDDGYAGDNRDAGAGAAAGAEPAGPSAEGDKPGEPASDAAEPADPGATKEPRRKGFLRRFRGD